jgi:hypothetical protein
MTDLLVFYPQGQYLYIEFLGARYIERQPKTPAQTEMFMLSVKPVVDQLDAYVLKHNLKEIIELNLNDVPLAKLNSDTALHLLHLMSEIRPDKNILQKIKITNSGPVFAMIYKGIRGKLPGRIRDIVEVETDSKFF